MLRFLRSNMPRRALHVPAWIFTALAGLPSGATASEPIDCGPQALYLLSVLEGRPVPPDSLAHAVDRRSPGGASLLELKHAGNRSGLSLRGVQLGRDLAPLDRPALVHLDRGAHGHFVVIRPIGHSGRLIQLIDPVEGPDVIDAEELTGLDSWTGAALIPSRTPWKPLACTVILGSLACVIGVSLRKSRGSPS